MTASQRIRLAREATKVERAWNSVVSVYPGAPTPFVIRETALTAGVSKARVCRYLGLAQS